MPVKTFYTMAQLNMGPLQALKGITQDEGADNHSNSTLQSISLKQLNALKICQQLIGTQVK